MVVATTLKIIDIDTAVALVKEGGAFVDLRPVDEYLDVHIPGSLSLAYEFGPGLASRARDCILLNVALVLIGSEGANLHDAAASLRGKGFTVVGTVEDGLRAWGEAHGTPASTEVITSAPTVAATILDVEDPGAIAPPEALTIPVERLWWRASELADASPVVIVAGYGVRAALAVGILERAGVDPVIFWKTRRSS